MKRPYPVFETREGGEYRRITLRSPEGHDYELDAELLLALLEAPGTLQDMRELAAGALDGLPAVTPEEARLYGLI